MKSLSTEPWRLLFPNAYPGNDCWRVTGGLCAFPPSTSAQDTVKLIETVTGFRPYLNWGLLTFDAAVLWSPSVLSKEAESRSRAPKPCVHSTAQVKRPLQHLWPKMTEMFCKRRFHRALAQELESSHELWAVACGGPWMMGAWQELEPSRELLWQFISAAGVLVSGLFTYRLSYESFLSSKKEMAMLFLLNSTGI